ncbi:MAG: hypothetical protein BJ554DRAFT_2168 [Olpidium bornovanus]|uniref:Uncharacterized protein n=1 Tax=Olpidium bornovanus TaxID=278681 RepID=A0A8H7ZRB1_9FUNG|nr:MAG: hypothetical protein BJ554DRAFT_2168 [Olpidium bornovanus]
MLPRLREFVGRLASRGLSENSDGRSPRRTVPEEGLKVDSGRNAPNALFRSISLSRARCAPFPVGQRPVTSRRIHHTLVPTSRQFTRRLFTALDERCDPALRIFKKKKKKCENMIPNFWKPLRINSEGRNEGFSRPSEKNSRSAPRALRPRAQDYRGLHPQSARTSFSSALPRAALPASFKAFFASAGIAPHVRGRQSRFARP